MTENSYNLKLLTAKKMTGNRDSSPILKAAKIGDAAELKRLLHEKSDLFFEEPTDEPLYPEHWKYHYNDLLETDKEGCTALHLAAAVGNNEIVSVYVLYKRTLKINVIIPF